MEADDRDSGRFKWLTYDDFRTMALDESLSRYEKIGFPNDYRRDREEVILEDMLSKLKGLRNSGSVVLDIGCGCSGLAILTIAHCEQNGIELVLVDSSEMLALLPPSDAATKVPARFPESDTLMERYAGSVDAIIIYSVLQHVFIEASIFEFLDSACLLLKDGGEILVGDIPNVSKRKRFFSSRAGAEFHRRFTGRDEDPEVRFPQVEKQLIDDGVVMGLLSRYRGFGFDAYLLPQDERLPMANRREDILIRKP